MHAGGLRGAPTHKGKLGTPGGASAYRGNLSGPAVYEPPKTNEKSMIHALELLGTSPERSGSAQDHLQVRSAHPKAAQDCPVRPRGRLITPL